MAEPSDSKHILVPKDGPVVVTAHPTVTEKEINDDRDIIILRLDAAYQNLNEAMAPFQKQWQAGWAAALTEATWDGASAGVSAWGDDFGDCFKKETWTALGDKIEKLAGTSYDTAAQYAAGRYKDVVDRINKRGQQLQAAPDAGEVLRNWAWQAFDDTVVEPTNRLTRQIKGAVNSASETAVMAQKIYAHRNEILELPNLIAASDRIGVQNFVTSTLMDIDPELAKSIREDPNFPVVLEIIDDHESALAYLAYASLAFEAVPPNFYAYAAGKGGAYLLVEVVLLVITALLSAGTVAAARIATLAARIALSGSKVAKVAKKVEEINKAFDAFVRLLNDFSRVSDQLHGLGEKLLRARTRDLRLTGNTKTTISAKREAIKREKKCLICGSTKHTTPHHPLGTVEYE
jgi:hypothetical protein